MSKNGSASGRIVGTAAKLVSEDISKPKDVMP